MNYVTSKKPKKASTTSAPPRREVEQQRQVIQKKLEQIRDYKRLLAEEGLVPDRADKERESRLIQQLLGLEKDQMRRDRQKGNFASSSNHGSKAKSEETKNRLSDTSGLKKPIPTRRDHLRAEKLP